ncbi:Rieske 2Fe-2S domain-containing protein [Roseiarcaceae bacterium H3SJ34-1]|uniref:Rieske 2Fe-2S domain-containing protein n=1 Tax=Terripilifer ovatus TaxID=3032367 RepID=UPI003AB91FB2|nr:Rieske 2Fe-2S domain-containing protein [Roseiarcaceae bacterium H3SJ34-1]
MNVVTPQDFSSEADWSSARAGVDLATTKPGTPGGIFMRRFWVAVHRSQDIARGEAKPIRIMSENFTIYRGASGAVHIVDAHCPHRFALMHLGWVEGDDIRCVYHGWKYDGTGQCIEQPAEDSSFARKVKIRSIPARDYLGLVFAYFGDGEPPAFPPFPCKQGNAVLDVWVPEQVPCNWLQSYENSMDEVHVAFTHAPGGSHASLAVDLPKVSAEETPWGMLRHGVRRDGKIRVSLHYAPNITRVLVPPRTGMDGVGGWREIYFSFTPIDDENHLWLLSGHVDIEPGSAAADEYAAKQAEYDRSVAAARPAIEVARDLIAGIGRFEDTRHPNLAVVQDVATQAGQGRMVRRDGERLGRSDIAIIQWRKILARELRAIADGKPGKQWSVAPSDIVPTLGF